MVEVYTLNDAALAEIIKNMLEAEGIPTHIDNRSQAGFTGILTAAIMVRAMDADRAQKLIESHSKNESP